MENMPSDPAQPLMRLDPIRKLFKDTWSIYRRSFWVLIGISVISLIVSGPAQILAQMLFKQEWRYSSIAGSVVVVLGFLVSFVGSIATIFIIARGTPVRESYRRAVKLLLPFIWILILIEATLLGGVIMLLIPAIFVSIAVHFAGFILPLEDRRGLASLIQSREYVRGYWWSIFGRNMLFGLVVILPVVVLSFVGMVVLGKIGGLIVYAVLATFMTPFLLCYAYVIYENLRRLKPDVASRQTTPHQPFFVVAATIGAIVIAGIITLTIIGGNSKPQPGTALTSGYENPPQIVALADVPVVAGYRIYQNQNMGINWLRYPEDWNLAEEGGEDFDFFIESPDHHSGVTGVLYADDSQSWTLEALYDVAKKGAQEGGVEFGEPTIVNINDREWLLTDYLLPVEGRTFQSRLALTILPWNDNHQFIKLLLESDEGYFEPGTKIFEEMLHSVTFAN